MYQDSEVVNLIMSIISLGIIWQFIKKEIERLRYFYLGFGFMVLAYFFTVAEGFICQNLFNSFEHLSYAIAGLTFAAASFNLLKIKGSEEAPNDE